jgi:ABC-type sugar transport system substrate-binding protein
MAEKMLSMSRVARITLSLVVSVLCHSSLAASVTFVNPGRSDEVFWTTASRGMQMAAGSLGIKLEIRYAERSPEKIIEIVKEVAAAKQTDYLIFPNEYALGGEVLKITEPAGIKTFFAYSTLSEAEFGKPRERYRNWIGSLVPDVEEAGFLTARELIAQGLAQRRFGKDGKLHLFAIAGDQKTPTSVLRTQGMLRAVKRERAVVLDQVVYADFNQQKAREMAAAGFEKFGDIRMVWAGNDLMAFGAMETLEKRGKVPGKDVLFSGINTSRQAMKAVQTGRLAALAGGHFMAGAWALVMIYDYHNGKDFASEGLVLTKPMFVMFTPELAKQYLAQFEGGMKGTDFRRYSKTHTPTVARYDFRLDRLLTATATR